MAASVKKPHVVMTERDSEEEELSETQEGSEDEGSGESPLDGGDDDNDVSGEESRDGDKGEVGSGEESADEGDEEAGGANEENPNASWAKVMAKILGKKTPEDKPCILLKNKRNKLDEKERKERMEKKKKADKKRTWEMMCRVKPDVVQDKERERNLQRTATRGVVQLFNAVRQHQKKVDEKMKEVGGSERKQAKVLSSISKKDFIDVLKGSAGCTTPTARSAKSEKDEKPAWSVLRDDFMTGSSMKDWDKESDAEPGGEPPRPAADYNSDSD